MIEKYKRVLQKRKAEKSLLESQMKELNTEIIRLTMERDDTIKARWVLSEVAKLTQNKFSERIEKLVTMAIRSVFDRPFEFVVKFDINRNTSECQLLVKEGGEEPFIPKDEEGGGLLDVISFALRVVLWSMQNPRSRNTLILDEPMKFTGSLIEKCGIMMRSISKKLGIQLIINTHSDDLSVVGDRVWYVSHNGVFSSVKGIEREGKL